MATTMRIRAWLLGLALALPACASAMARGEDGTGADRGWIAGGGTLGLRWNRDLLAHLHLRLAATADVLPPAPQREHGDFQQRESFALVDDDPLEFQLEQGSFRRFGGGSLRTRGGYLLELPGGRIDLRGMILRPGADRGTTFDVYGDDGKPWFYVDRPMFELSNDARRLELRASDLRIAPALAVRLGVPEAAGWAVADLGASVEIRREGEDLGGACAAFRWPGEPVPGVPGAIYQADLFMQSLTVQASRCDGCDGPGGGDGRLVLTPSSTLRNNRNDGAPTVTIPGDPRGTSTVLHAADIAWYAMFSGEFPPYGNDQHPYLIWNLYRFNADGSLEQIGRSGVKHAFLTVNGDCEADAGCDSHVLGRGCSDTYGIGNNDANANLGPRSEIVPAQGLWGRCGSIWDPQCTGNEQANGNGNYEQRLITRESQIDPVVNPGASYLFEAWYLVRDDIDIYNSMASVSGMPNYVAASRQWAFGNQANYRLGPVIDRWVGPDQPDANARNSELASAEGHVRLAVKATALGDGNWRYDYAVMNLDFARAVIEPAVGGVAPRVLGSRGFDRFGVAAGGNVIAQTRFRDGDLDAGNDWRVDTSGSDVVWHAPAGASLDWGVLYSYSIAAAAAPVEGIVRLHVAEAGTPETYEFATLVPAPQPQDDTVFANGFDG